MKRSIWTQVISLILIGMIVFVQTGCTPSDNISEINSDEVEEIKIDYVPFITFPSSGGTYDYYSYGYHYSSVTVSDFSYIVSEQSEDEIRIDFKFVCTFDYLGEKAGGSSINFYINVYNNAGEKVDESIVNETNIKIGETGTTAHTILIDKDVVVQGITIKFEGNS